MEIKQFVTQNGIVEVKDIAFCHIIGRYDDLKKNTSNAIRALFGLSEIEKLTIKDKNFTDKDGLLTDRIRKQSLDGSYGADVKIKNPSSSVVAYSAGLEGLMDPSEKYVVKRKKVVLDEHLIHELKFSIEMMEKMNIPYFKNDIDRSKKVYEFIKNYYEENEK